MNLTTPKSKLDEFRGKLYAKAKTEPAFRFYGLYDKIYRWDVLTEALKQSKSKRGAPGVDGQTFEQIETYGEERWLKELQQQLLEKTYQPQPVRRVLIPKPGGGERPLGIPTIRDRVAQTAAKLILEPIFDADLSDSAYGYRPRAQRSPSRGRGSAAFEGRPNGSRGRRSREVLRHHSARRTDEVSGTANSGWSGAALDQAVVEGASRRARRAESTENGRRQKLYARSASGRRDFAATGEHLYQSAPEGGCEERDDGADWSQDSQLCRRLRGGVLEGCRGGVGADCNLVDEDEVEPQSGQDEREERMERLVRLSGIRAGDTEVFRHPAAVFRTSAVKESHGSVSREGWRLAQTRTARTLGSHPG